MGYDPVTMSATERVTRVEEAARVTAHPPRRWWWPAGADAGLNLLGPALAVAACYYLGARIGFLLQAPSVPTSVLWPPNAILSAALLLSPVRRWWIFVLAVIPAHFGVQLGVVESPWLATAWFATNWSEALIAAVIVRRFSDAPVGFDTLKRMAVFIVGAGLVAPFASSFLDATAVALLQGDPYWMVWRTRFFANVLTELTLTSTIVIAIEGRRRWIATIRRRFIEILFFALAFLTGGLSIFSPYDLLSVLGLPSDQQLLLPFLLPVLLWGTVRFGPLGTSLSLLTLTSFGVWALGDGGRPFTTLPAGQAALALQLGLIMVAIPLLCLAAVILERRQSEAALSESEAALSEALCFEGLLSDLSSVFVRVPSEKIEHAIRLWLEQFAEFLALDRLTLLRQADGGAIAEWYAWSRPTSAAPRDPTEAEAFRLEMALLAYGRAFGTLTLDGRNRAQLQRPEWIARLAVVAEIIGCTLAKKDAEDALRTSESMSSAILASLTASVAVLDREGRIVAVNDAWRRGKEAPGEGVNYAELWRLAAREGQPHAPDVMTGIAAVLEGTRPEFSIEYTCGATAGEQWWAMSVVPLSRPEGGAVVSRSDVTERRQAEVQAQRIRLELAHFTRVTTMGELTTSIAHELNQPLTAILANAQAAKRLLASARPDLEEVEAILSDIIADDRRAGAVIHRIRDMLAKREPEPSQLDLNLLIEDVVTLLTSDLLINNVTVTLDLADDLPPVDGDRVQIQQVMLNLLLNAIDAVKDRLDRTILIQTLWREAVHVSVRDAGPGLAPGTHERVFQPFYTTKSAGMGMGLAISHSIIEAHSGLIWATDNPTGGATFHFALPAPPRPSAE
jgi:signal transduction histidine kinase/integral membrane sensor domain MASE1